MDKNADSLNDWIILFYEGIYGLIYKENMDKLTQPERLIKLMLYSTYKSFLLAMLKLYLTLQNVEKWRNT